MAASVSLAAMHFSACEHSAARVANAPRVAAQRVIGASEQRADQVVGGLYRFGQVATAVLGPLTMAHRIVTDSGVSPEIIARLHDLGIEVIVA